MAAGAGGRWPGDERGLCVLQCTRHLSVSTWSLASVLDVARREGRIEGSDEPVETSIRFGRIRTLHEQVVAARVDVGNDGVLPRAEA